MRMGRKHRSTEDRREGAGGASRGRDREDARAKVEYDERAERRRPDAPDGWRSMMSTDYDYPEELDELNGRDRRRAKKKLAA